MIFVPADAFPMTYLTLCFKGGALLDPVGREGLSAVCQRLVMSGTRRLGRDAFNAAVEGLGADVSLVTQPHYTAVTTPALTRALPELLDLLTEALTAPALDPEEVARVARVYAAELEATWDDDGYLAWLWLSRRLFADHPLWRKVSVTPEGLRALTEEDARGRWGSLYCREALLPCLSGSLSREEAEGLMGRLRDALPSAPAGAAALLGAPASAQMPALAPLRRARLTLVRKAQRRQAQVLVAQPAPPPRPRRRLGAPRGARRARRHLQLAAHAGGAREARAQLRRVGGAPRGGGVRDRDAERHAGGGGRGGDARGDARGAAPRLRGGADGGGGGPRAPLSGQRAPVPRGDAGDARVADGARGAAGDAD